MIPIGQVQNYTSNVQEHKIFAPIGFLFALFGQAFKVYDDMTHSSFYLTKDRLVTLLTARQGLTCQSQRLTDRILEVINPIIGDKIRLSKIRQLEQEIASADLEPKQGRSSLDRLIEKLETIRDRRFTRMPLDMEKLSRVLKPGDLIFRKYHEDNPNPICTLQKLFKGIIQGKKEREGHKYSHVAMYVGNGEIAEASMPHGNEPQVRILKLRDSRFALKAKNQYRVVRPTDAVHAQKSAKVFRSFAVVAEEGVDSERGLKYTYLEALRSLWHSASFGYFAKQRYLKYYADYVDGMRPTQVTLPRHLFCSHAVGMACQIADGLTRNIKQIVGDPPTKIKNSFLRALVRGLWSRYHAIVHRKELDAQVKTQYDPFRSSPQDMRNYVLRHPEQYRELLIIDGF